MSADVVIVGGGMIGASIAWWTAQNPDFSGKIIVVERDLTYQHASTTATNSCIRQQFGTELNIRISQFGVEFIKNFRDFIGDPSAPEIHLHPFGYLYLADTPEFAASLKVNQRKQAALGAGTQILTQDEIAEKWPFYALDDILLGSHNPVDEGYFDGGTIFDWMKRKGRDLGVEYVNAEVVGLRRRGMELTGVLLDDGSEIACGIVVNAAGPRADDLMAMADLQMPVEPRKRFTFIFDCEEDLGQDLPLTIDPSGVHMRTDGRYFMCGCPPDNDGPVDPMDFEMDHNIWMDKVWPAIASRVPAFERVKVMNEWVGHYAYNPFDRNAILGWNKHVHNLIMANGFSGHGLQQSPAVARGMSELIVYGHYMTLDLSDLGHNRILQDRPLIERAVI